MQQKTSDQNSHAWAPLKVSKRENLVFSDLGFLSQLYFNMDK